MLMFRSRAARAPLLGAIGGAPAWVLNPGPLAILDIDFVNDRAWNTGLVSISSLLTCTRSSDDAYYTNADGTLTGNFDANTLRYGTNGLLVEESRTNICLRSQEFDHASWIEQMASQSVTANATTAPDGTSTADKLVTGSAAGNNEWQRTITWTNVQHVLSVYAKKAEYDYVYLVTWDGTTDRSAWFNLDTGAVGTVNGSGATASIQALANGWYRCILVFTPVVATQFFGIGLSDADNARPYTGDGASGIYVWSAQLEVGSFPTSPILTTSSSATRAADIVYMLTSGIGGFDNTKGTLYFEASAHETEPPSNFYAGLHDNTGSSYICMRQQTGGSRGAEKADASDTVSLHFEGSAVDGVSYKTALAYAVNDYAGCEGGGTVDTDTSATVPPCTHLQLGGGLVVVGFGHWNGYIKRAGYWNSRLSNAALQTVTT